MGLLLVWSSINTSLILKASMLKLGRKSILNVIILSVPLDPKINKNKSKLWSKKASRLLLIVIQCKIV